MIEMLTDPNLWAAFLTLAALEIVLGIDNIIFISIVTGKLPLHQQPRARQIGLSLALGMRVVMLLGISWIAGLTEPVMTVADFALSWRDIVLGLGGLFLLYKATGEIHKTVETATHLGASARPRFRPSSFRSSCWILCSRLI